MAVTQTPAGDAPPHRGRYAVMLVAVAPLLRWLIARYTVESTQPPRASCDGCGSPLRPPAAAGSALLPLGRCGQCRTKIGAPALAVELAAVSAVGIAVLAAPSAPLLIAILWWAACAVPLLFIDLRVHRLPDALTGAAFAGVLMLLTVAAAAGHEWAPLLRAVLCAAVYSGLFLVVALLLGSRGIGLGDVKLIVSVAALLGWWSWGAVFGAVFLGFLAAGVVSVALLVTRRVGRGAHIAMGPFFIAGTMAMLVLLARSAG